MQEKQGMDTKIIALIAVIGVMFVAIIVMAFMLGKQSWTVVSPNGQTQANYEDLTIQVITDSRDMTTPVDSILDELKQLPSISKADIVEKDFSDKGVSDFLKENDIKTLPALVFSTKKFDVSDDPIQPGQQYKINEYLYPLPNGEYYLEIGATYDPFVERSERGFKIMEEWLLEEIKSNSYTKGNTDAEVTWLEFSDFGCTYCQKMHATDKTPAKVLEEYGENVNIIFMNMPFRNREASEAVECIGELAWTDAYYTAIDGGFANSLSTASQFYDLVSSSVNKEDFDACVSEKRGSTRIDYHMSVGQEKFNVQWTPNNVLINNTTGEYEVLPWAYPFDSFKDLIDNLLVD